MYEDFISFDASLLMLDARLRFVDNMAEWC